jgi:hypothetical protein
MSALVWYYIRDRMLQLMLQGPGNALTIPTPDDQHSMVKAMLLT